ncbi:MAG TPA: WXG100 family type VII secretion target [Actinophytocola sp.]|uniref:WXG100 family type VII secretion target n=1 Tax=Actinophytocola sp. TaxID=1872138 RepID=UPI002DBCB061|nr:WXG100 family type VII secretion target [Actinophytocola sp.]HEU5475325.1 WXG100 family type VII secretion target [Actinophytocola sp.]
MPEKPNGHTDFSRYSHAQLYAMLHAGEEGSARSAADSWDAVGARLHEQAGNLDARLARFREHWQGGAADAYAVMITDLAGGLRRIGDAAFAVRDAAHDTADALHRAKAEMPPPVEVPEVSPTTVHLATATIEVDPMASPESVAQLRRAQADAVAAVQNHQQAANAANAAHAKAVAVMVRLAGEYRRSERSIPHLNIAGRPPGAPGSGHGHGHGGALDDVDLLNPNGSRPMFGSMFTAGLAAATAAAAGRLGMPRIPTWAEKKKEEPAAETDPDKAKAALTDGLKGVGGGGGIGKIGGFGAAPPVPVAHNGMLGAGPPPVAAAGLGGLAAAGAAAGAGAATGGMPMMPFMPFAPMGMDMAGGRRVPPWLVETEEVWGESSVITPPVIGADPPGDPNPHAGFQF